MDLPIRLQEGWSDECLVSVDGAWDQAGLNLSHWPGQRTPPELRHELSTGAALLFARLAPSRRAELARGAVAIANNHYDTDGVCAVFAVRYPGRALERAKALLDAAAAGDFFRVPNERAYAVDLVITGLADPALSPWRERFAGLDDRARREFAVIELVDRLPEILDGDLAQFGDLWRSPMERLRADRAALAAAARDDVAHLDLCVFTQGARGERFDPGRHALFGGTTADRVLAVGRVPGGATYRLLLGTSSWFDLPVPRTLPRPMLEPLAARLNELEGTRAEDACAWRAQPTASPSPELWFGAATHPFFSEHAAALAPSRLAPEVVRPLVLDALRATWAFPDD